MIISFTRSVMCSHPSGSIQPTSPVRYQPSTKASALASSGKYPAIIAGLRAWISPTSPGGSTAPVSKWAMRMSTSWTGGPGESSRHSSGRCTGLLVSTGASLAP